MRRTILLIITITVFLCSFQVWMPLQFQVPDNWPSPVYDFSQNPLTMEKINLGRALFYDPILSRNNTISCANCHSQYSAFTHIDHALSHGIDDKIGTRNSPSLMNLAWQKEFMWDGAITHLDMQPLSPINNHNEMDEKTAHVISKLQATKLYPQLFESAFGDTSITGQRLLKAIAQFMLTLVSSNSKYDSVMRNQSIFTNQEASGYGLFKTNCASCHTEPLFTNYAFENNGLPLDTSLNDIGRMGITQNPDDSLKFKVPTLRNIQFSYPYMHDGRFKRLSEVINHYTSNIKYSKTLSKKLQKPIVLNPKEKVDLVAFLYTLTDHHFLFDSSFSFPKKIFFDTVHK